MNIDETLWNDEAMFELEEVRTMIEIATSPRRRDNLGYALAVLSASKRRVDVAYSHLMKAKQGAPFTPPPKEVAP